MRTNWPRSPPGPITSKKDMERHYSVMFILRRTMSIYIDQVNVALEKLHNGEAYDYGTDDLDYRTDLYELRVEKGAELLCVLDELLSILKDGRVNDYIEKMESMREIDDEESAFYLAGVIAGEIS